MVSQDLKTVVLKVILNSSVLPTKHNNFCATIIFFYRFENFFPELIRVCEVEFTENGKICEIKIFNHVLI